MKRATITTTHDHPDELATAIKPDNTKDMTTNTYSQTIVTTITRPTTGGLRNTVDDYIVNLNVAHHTQQLTTD